MKKLSLKKLALKTEKVSDFDSQNIKGGGSGTWTVISGLGCIAIKTITSISGEPKLTTRTAPDGMTEC